MGISSRAGAFAAALITVLAAPVSASRFEIPSFARKYRVTCALCHEPAPKLSEFGETFASQGFEFRTGEEPDDTTATGDPLLRLMRDLPLAVRFDFYAQALTDATGVQTSNDLQTPWAIKLLSGGQVADGISYYLYFFLSERGEVAGLEDAYIQFTDVGASGVNVMVGQFQVSDPLFKRELRLEYEDYQAYRVQVGNAEADLTYDRGVMLTWAPAAATDVAVSVVNGRGLERATEARQYDVDTGKNLAGRLSQGLGPVRLGLFGYYGNEESDGVENEILVWGPDATLALGRNLEINLQYLVRSDENPFFLPEPPEDEEVRSGFGEIVWWPGGRGGRLAFTGLYNLVDADLPLFTVGQGEEDLLSRYETIALGGNYLLKRNVRVLGEMAWNAEREQARFTLGAMTAF